LKLKLPLKQLIIRPIRLQGDSKQITMLKYFVALFILTLALSSCKKETSKLEASSFLDVEEKNMAVAAKLTATWCEPCGGWGFDFFASLKDDYKDKAVFMAFTHSLSDVAPQGDEFFVRVNQLFSIGGGTPRFFYNFDTIYGVNHAGASGILQHIESEVIASSNYEYTLSDDKIHLKTTTKFFKSQEGDFMISPFLIIDNQEGPQLGRADSPNTVHSAVVAELAHPINSEVLDLWAYKVASGKVKKGYQINLEFETARDPLWTEDDISFALVLYKRVGNKYKFVNAFTK